MSKNNFDLIRIILAVTVMLFHIGGLANIQKLTLFPGGIAVNCFFVISGYLITKSYINNSDIRAYARSRFLRVFPLYFLVVFISFIVGGFITSKSFDLYFIDGAKYLFYNILFLNFLQPTLPGVFSDLSNGGAVNGSLWTIKIEVMFYVSVPIIYGYFARFLAKEKLTISIMAMSIGCFYFLSYLVSEYDLNGSINNQLPSLMSYFMVGAYFNFIDIRKIVIVRLFPLSILGILSGVDFLMPLSVGVFVMFLVFCTPVVSISTRVGDLSYGVYVWHFPVIQLYLYMGVFSNPFWAVFNVSITVFLLAYISWHCIEKKCLNRKNQYSSA